MQNDKRRNSLMLNIVAAAGSGKLAIILILLLCAFCTIGAVLPQEGRFAPHEISAWQQAHPLATALFTVIGGFHVFHSIPFTLNIAFLGINTLICTIARLSRLGVYAGTSLFRGVGALRHVGFLVLHTSLLLLFIGGMVSSIFSLDGFLVLVEGMTVQEAHDSYAKLVEGPAREDIHSHVGIRLDAVQEKLVDDYPVDQTAMITILAPDRTTSLRTARIAYNKPLQYQGNDLTLDKTGLAPEIVVFDRLSRTVPVDSYIVLKTFGRGPEVRYRDFIAEKIFYDRNQKVFLTVYPASATIDNMPLLLVDIVDKAKDTSYHAEIPLHGRADVGEYAFFFRDLKRWASLRMMDDPGYPYVWFGLWLGLAGILLRYIPDFLHWSGRPQSPGRSVPTDTFDFPAPIPYNEGKRFVSVPQQEQ